MNEFQKWVQAQARLRGLVTEEGEDAGHGLGRPLWIRKDLYVGASAWPNGSAYLNVSAKVDATMEHQLLEWAGVVRQLVEGAPAGVPQGTPW